MSLHVMLLLGSGLGFGPVVVLCEPRLTQNDHAGHGEKAMAVQRKVNGKRPRASHKILSLVQGLDSTFPHFCGLDSRPQSSKQTHGDRFFFGLSRNLRMFPVHQIVEQFLPFLLAGHLVRKRRSSFTTRSRGNHLCA
ncbi:hypothetical protein MPTK1_4g09060 [Marchantia polymorpha subsp. ruderalis]|uniref:Secreted protein n=2 Tax=Marchantia polymorpha TaxID=3197 RepID=A0AAF6B7Y7_MARPO|nr:hypothetical protein MARPO_0112s0007 [Marchantia polymorpha]BBN08121.1 hypothetical protein Mp_4g09060 [Marchantia polymorpha subsp. ruderalis]|eukprot:PTQ31346.1 hypothetical protein MARPO_0112s0007 [Marchantia polymorpha]